MIVDFTDVPAGTRDHPAATSARTSRSAAAMPGVDFAPADPDTTGQVMQFRVVAATGADTEHAARPARAAARSRRSARRRSTRQVSLNELESATVMRRATDGRQRRPRLRERRAVRPAEARPGHAQPGRHAATRSAGTTPITENPALGATEIWEIYNFTADAHPIHIHQVQFQVVDRQPIDATATPATRPPEPWETGLQGHGHRLPGRDHPRQGAVRHRRACTSGTATSSSTRTTR